MQHASCKLKLARKPITTAIKLATTVQDLCKSCRVVASSFEYLCACTEIFKWAICCSHSQRCVCRERDFCWLLMLINFRSTLSPHALHTIACSKLAVYHITNFQAILHSIQFNGKNYYKSLILDIRFSLLLGSLIAVNSLSA